MIARLELEDPEAEMLVDQLEQLVEPEVAPQFAANLAV